MRSFIQEIRGVWTTWVHYAKLEGPGILFTFLRFIRGGCVPACYNFMIKTFTFSALILLAVSVAAPPSSVIITGNDHSET